jgi:hypothetical protein
VVELNNITDIRTGERHDLGLIRGYTLPQAFGVLVFTQDLNQHGEPRTEKIVYDKYFGESGIKTYAAVDWYLAHLALYKGASEDSDDIRNILSLSHRRLSQDGSRMVGYDHEQVAAFLTDLAAFEQHRADSRMANYQYQLEHPKTTK